MQAYTVAFAAVVLWFLSSLGSLRPRTTILVGLAAAAVTYLVLVLGAREEEGGHEEP